jgi:hypothetical protein
MKSYRPNLRGRRLAFLLVVLAVILGLTSLRSNARTSAISITITNNSTGWEIQHVYLSPSNQDKWGPNQLSSALGPGNLVTLSGIACDQADIRVITEDQDGCFLYKTVSCSDNATWTITNGATPDCGN